MPQEQGKIERVPTFLESLLAEWWPNMVNPDAMEENAQLLQQGGSGNSPEKMAKVLKVAGHGVADATGAGVRANVPQSPEDVVMQYGPLGPAVGKAIGAGAKLVAGLPFWAYLPKLGKMRGIGHGTTAVDKVVTEGIDPSRFDESDVLGWLMHGAEDPNYFNRYAVGAVKNTANGTRPGVIPLAPQAKNVLDLVEPNVQDLAQAVGQITDVRDRAQLLRSFKSVRADRRGLLEDADLNMAPTNEQWELGNVMRENWGLNNSHHPDLEVPSRYRLADDPVVQNAPALHLAETLRLDPDTLKSSPFDAIRYNDMSNKSWAFDPERIKVETPFGVEIPVKRRLAPHATFMANPDGSVHPNIALPDKKWDQLHLTADQMAESRARQLSNFNKLRIANENRRKAILYGIDPYFADNIDDDVLARFVEGYGEGAFSQAETTDALKAWQYHNPGRVHPYQQAEKLGEVTQALVPSKRMQKVVLDR